MYASRQAEVARDAKSLRQQIAELAQKRLDAGDISELEVTTTTIRDRVTLEVRTAYTQLHQARENLQMLQAEILPSLESAELLARKNYQNGGSTYFMVLQTTGPYLDARVRESQLFADVRRATAELERSVGMRLANPSAANAPAPDTLIEIDSELLR